MTFLSLLKYQSNSLNRKFPTFILSVFSLMIIFTGEALGHEHEHHEDQNKQPAMEHMHHQHNHSNIKEGYVRSVKQLNIPNAKLVDMEGAQVSLSSELNSGKPIMLNFIFTTCTAICPIMSATFSQVREELGPDRSKIEMISISIDPEHDTPEKLKEYAKKYHADEGWQFLTGDLALIVSVQKAFDAYRGDKMNHIPLTFLRRSPKDPWVRLEGFTSAKDLLHEYHNLSKDAL